VPLDKSARIVELKELLAEAEANLEVAAAGVQWAVNLREPLGLALTEDGTIEALEEGGQAATAASAAAKPAGSSASAVDPPPSSSSSSSSSSSGAAPALGVGSLRAGLRVASLDSFKHCAVASAAELKREVSVAKSRGLTTATLTAVDPFALHRCRGEALRLRLASFARPRALALMGVRAAPGSVTALRHALEEPLVPPLAPSFTSPSTAATAATAATTGKEMATVLEDAGLRSFVAEVGGLGVPSLECLAGLSHAALTGPGIGMHDGHATNLKAIVAKRAADRAAETAAAEAEATKVEAAGKGGGDGEALECEAEGETVGEAASTNPLVAAAAAAAAVPAAVTAAATTVPAAAVAAAAAGWAGDLILDARAEGAAWAALVRRLQSERAAAQAFLALGPGDRAAAVAAMHLVRPASATAEPAPAATATGVSGGDVASDGDGASGGEWALDAVGCIRLVPTLAEQAALVAALESPAAQVGENE